MFEMAQTFGLSPLDIAIGAISFLVGMYTKKENKRGIGLFLQVTLLLIRIAKHYLDTHPEGRKVGSKYKLEVDTLYKKTNSTSNNKALG